MNRTSRILLGLSLAAFWTGAALGQDENRGMAVVDPQGETVLSIGKSYALLIGASAYTAGWRPLPGVKQDLLELERVFKAHGFEVTVIHDPNAEQLRGAFETFIRDHGREETNRLLIYYAGHGHTESAHERPRGYLVPVDAPLPEENNALFLDKAFPLHAMSSLALDIYARQAIFFFDSCFSGSIFGDLSRGPAPPPASISYLTGRPVRQFISSGSAGQTVPDRSEFRVQLVDALDGKTDLSTDKYVTGTELGNFLFRRVMDSSNKQTPQYGTLGDGVYDKGDFVFVIPPKPAAQGSETVAAPPLAARAAISRIAILPPTLIDLGAEVREDLGRAIVGSVNGLAGTVMSPDSVSDALTAATLERIAACQADGGCLLQVCGMLDVDLAVATVFEKLTDTSTADVIVIDDAACKVVGRTTRSADTMDLLGARAEKATRTLVSGWRP